MYFCGVKIHEKYIKRCIQLAQSALGSTYPNPMVGSVIVYKERVIGEGWHQKAGQAHAEVNAINSVKDKSLLPKSTIYVSLEPCSHYGKTPPCSDLIIASGIKRVIIGTIDPFAKVAGRGIKKLLDAGCEVTVGILERECQEVNKRFFTYHQSQRPYIILKWAQTQDGFIAPADDRLERSPVWISNRYSKQLSHKLRAEEEAILVGTNTAVADDPRLNTRLWKGANPIRVVLDRNLRIPQDSEVFQGSIKTIVICDQRQLPNSAYPGEHVVTEAIDFERSIAFQVCNILFKYEIQSLIVEGGSQTLQTFIDANLWDEAMVFTGGSTFKKGIKGPHLSGRLLSETVLEGDSLKLYKND